MNPSLRLWTPKSLDFGFHKRSDAFNRMHSRTASASHPGEKQDEFGEWSEEFTTLCQEQLELVQATIPNIASGTVFFRREHPTSGVLEFIPVATYPNDPRVWISHGGLASEPVSSRVLPGGIPAVWILPDYPFLNQDDAQLGFVASDGSLCVPIMFSSVVAGSLVLRRPSSVPMTRAWAEKDVARVRIVARSISLAAQLEGRWLSASQALQRDSELLQSLGDLIRGTVHQIRSPITALVTFGRVLLRRLPVGDENRSIAKSILVAGFRLDDLLRPLDAAGDRLRLPSGNGTDSELANGNFEWEWHETKHGENANKNGYMSVIDLVPDVELPSELFWVSDILLPIAEASATLAEARGLTFVRCIDEDAPPVMGHEKSIREVVHNFLDNALKYTPRDGIVGLAAGVAEESPDVVEIVVWDTGPGISVAEKEKIWEHGRRGAAGLESGASGSGLGLAIAKDLVDRQNGTVDLQSPVPYATLSRFLGERKIDRDAQRGPGSLFRITLRRPGR